MSVSSDGQPSGEGQAGLPSECSSKSRGDQAQERTCSVDESEVSRLYYLRSTPQGLAACQLVSAEVVQRLATKLEEGSAFRDASARHRFGVELQWWVYRCIMRRDAALPHAERKKVHKQERTLTPQEVRGAAPQPLPRELRAELTRLLGKINKAQHAVAEAERALAELDALAFNACSSTLLWPEDCGDRAAAPSLPGPPVTREEAVAVLNHVCRLRRAWLQELDRSHLRLVRLGCGASVTIAGRRQLGLPV